MKFMSGHYFYRRRQKYFSAEKSFSPVSARLPPALHFGSLSQNSLHRWQTPEYIQLLLNKYILADFWKK